MCHVPTALVLTQHFDKANFQEIEESVYVFDKCTSLRNNTYYCKYLQLITEHRDLFLVGMFGLCKAFICKLYSILLAYLISKTEQNNKQNHDVTRTGLTLPNAEQNWTRPSNHCRSNEKQYPFVQNNSCSAKTKVTMENSWRKGEEVLLSQNNTCTIENNTLFV